MAAVGDGNVWEATMHDNAIVTIKCQSHGMHVNQHTAMPRWSTFVCFSVFPFVFVFLFHFLYLCFECTTKRNLYNLLTSEIFGDIDLLLIFAEK